MSARRRQRGRGKRGGRFWGALAFVVLFLLFLGMGFPSDGLKSRTIAALERATGAKVVFQEIESVVEWGVPKLRFRQGRLVWPSGLETHVSYARVKPQFAWGWLIGRPRYALKVVSDFGAFRGSIAPHNEAITGTFENVDLAKIPYDRLGVAIRGSGLLVATLRGERDDNAWIGAMNFRASDGTLQLGALPLPIPFDLSEGQLEIREREIQIIDNLRVDGPMGDAAISGSVARGGSNASLDLDVDLKPKDPNMSRVFAGLGLQVNPNGGRVHVSGTLRNPHGEAIRGRRRR